MKNIIFTALICFTGISNLQAQSVSAEEIISQINRGEDVLYENLKITGVLDFTALENQKQVKKGGGWFSSGDAKFESQVDVKIEFINCTFEDDVLAYYNVDNAIYEADFKDNVIFKDCVFKEKSEFKYSKFSNIAMFSECIFEEIANFKYAEFSRGPDFSNSKFEEEANFKYSKFEDSPDFALATFNDDANFKYADFPYGVSFESVTFERLANFKYSKFSEPLNMESINFKGSEDFKYTEIDGQSFTTYLLKTKN